MPHFFKNKSNENNTNINFLGHMEILNKHIPIFSRGNGNIPLLVVGPASLFMKDGLIPFEFDSYFTIYFVDFFAKRSETLSDIKAIRMEHFVEAVERVRKRLSLKDIALFCHSSSGVLGIEYALQYKNRVLFSIIVATAPIWGPYKDVLVSEYFKYNAPKSRLTMFARDQKEASGQSDFVLRYHARRAHFYRDPFKSEWAHLWDSITLDEPLISRYFELINSYSIVDAPLKGLNIFLALGLYDYSNPFYAWTDEGKAKLREPGIEHYIFEDSAHYPQVEEKNLFVDKIREYLTKNFSNFLTERLSVIPSHL